MRLKNGTVHLGLRDRYALGMTLGTVDAADIGDVWLEATESNEKALLRLSDTPRCGMPVVLQLGERMIQAQRRTLLEGMGHAAVSIQLESTTPNEVSQRASATDDGTDAYDYDATDDGLL